MDVEWSHQEGSRFFNPFLMPVSFSALLELSFRELLFTPEPTVSNNSSLWQQRGAKG